MRFFRYWRENLRRTVRDEGDRQVIVGMLALILGSFGYAQYAERPDIQYLASVVGFTYVLMLLFIVTPARMWNEARQQIYELEDRARPRLRLVFQPDAAPYLQEVAMSSRTNPPVATQIERRYRVGILNEGSEVVPRVRVVLESFGALNDERYYEEPSVENQVFLEHALNVMGYDEKLGLVDVAPGDRPTAFVDVVAQTVTHGDALGLVPNDEGDWNDLTADWRATRNRRLSETWRESQLTDVCKVITDGDHQAPPKAASGIPFLTIGNINAGRLDFSSTRFVPSSYFASIKAERKPRRGDVLYSVAERGDDESRESAGRRGTGRHRRPMSRSGGRP